MPPKKKEVNMEEEDVVTVSSLPEALAHRQTFEGSLQEREAPLLGVVYQPEGGKWGRLQVGNETFGMTDLSMRQLAGHLPAFSLGMFQQASLPLRKTMLEEFVTYVETDATFKYLLMEEGGNSLVMRGIVPASRVTIPDSDVLMALLEAFGEDHSKVVTFNGPGLDDPQFLRVRVLRDQVLADCTEELYPAVDLTLSSLGWGPIELRYCLYRKVCNNGLVLPFPETDGPYFSHDYKGMSTEDFTDVFRRAASSFGTHDEVVAARVAALQEVRMDGEELQDAYKKLILDEKLGKGVVQKAFAEIPEAGGMSRWEFINSVTKVAQTYRPQLQLRYEVAMGAYFGLQLAHPAEEDLA